MGASNAIATALKEDANWVEDEVRSGCFHCEESFSLTVRRHHCRCCGEIFCKTCWGPKVKLPISQLFPGTSTKLDQLQRRQRSGRSGSVAQVEFDKAMKLLRTPQPVCKVCHNILEGVAKIFLGPSPLQLRLRRVGLKPTESDLNGAPAVRGSPVVAVKGNVQSLATPVPEEGSPKAVVLTGPFPAEPETGLADYEGRLEDSTTQGDQQGAVIKHSLEDHHVNHSSVRWSSVITDDYDLSLGQWMPFTKGTHLRFQRRGYQSEGRERGMNASARGKVGGSTNGSSISTRTLPIYSGLPRFASYDSLAEGGGEGPVSRGNSPQPEGEQVLQTGSLDSATGNGEQKHPEHSIVNRFAAVGSATTGSLSDRRRVVTITPTASPSQESIDNSSSNFNGVAYDGQVVLLSHTANSQAEGNRPVSALKKTRTKNRDRRDLVVTPRASLITSNGASGGNNVDNVAAAAGWDPALPPSWRIGCRSVISVEAAPPLSAELGGGSKQPLVRLETATQVLLFELADTTRNEGTALVAAIRALKEVSLIRARTHVAVGDSSRNL